MLFQIKTINGQKTIVPLTADTGTGAPVGSLIAMYKKSSPSGYLYCDGSTFDQTKYPALYQYLGSNVLPDFREFALVGAEENTTDVYNASTNPNGTIHDHDVYTEGQAKDDQLQDHNHRLSLSPDGAYTLFRQYGGGSANNALQDTVTDYNNLIYASLIEKGRHGTVTRGKRKAVYFYIKATSGLTENQQENVLNTINENLSYSTTEHKTGKKWYDGKDIYSKVVDFGALPNNTTKTVAHNISNLNEITKIEGIAKGSFAGGSTVYIQLGHASNTATEDLAIVDNNVNITTTTDRTNFTAVITLEYTKTT